MPTVRRSKRIRQKLRHEGEEDGGAESQMQSREVSVVQTDEHTNLVDVQRVLSEEETDVEQDHESDEDYQDGRSRPKSQNKRPRSGESGDSKGRSKKRARTIRSTNPAKIVGIGTGTKKEQDQYLSMLQDFEPTRLFHIFSTSEDVSVEEVASDWLDQYKEHRSRALKEFVNFLLNCTGSLVQVAEHDVVNNDSSNETIGEIQMLFRDQKIHEFHLYMSKMQKKRSKYKPLYENFVEFMSKVIELANDKDMMYVEKTEEAQDGETNIVIETGPLMLDLLTWLSSMSVCKIRCLRYISTLCMYIFQDQLTDLMVNLDTQVLFKLRKQLAMEQKKKKQNKKTIHKLESTIADVEGTKTVIESNIDNIVKLCFVHRFKDVDECIRSESILHLAQWLENYPEYFFKATYLKYFGWLLSDSSHVVRLQVLKTLSQLVRFSNEKNMTDNSSLRQFFERFKQRILEIALKDIELQVRLASVQVLALINGFGYLEDSEILSITSLIFHEHQVKVSSSAKNAKFLSAVSKFFSNVEKEQQIDFLDKHRAADSMGDIQVGHIVEAGVLMRFLIKSLSVHLRAQGQQQVKTERNVHLLFQAAEFLQPYFINTIEPLCQLLTYEGSFSDFDVLNRKYTSNYGSDDEEEEEEEEGTRLLLPEDENSIIQYVTVLSGFCHGAMNLRQNQSKGGAIEVILTYLLDLFANLNLDSDVILNQLVSIFKLFRYEDWISHGQEASFRRIFEILIKNFDNSSIETDIKNPRQDAFINLLSYTQKLSLADIDGLWKNKLISIKISLAKYLKQLNLDNNDEANDKIQVLHTMYLNKLVLLGKHFRLEFDQEFLELLFTNYINKLSQVLLSLTPDTLVKVNFKALTQMVTWNLQTWYQIFEENITPSSVSRPMLESNKFIIDQLSIILITLHREDGDLSNKLQVEYSINTSLLNIIIAVKMFTLNLSDKESEWKRVIKREYPIYLDSPEAILQVFLYLEAMYANKLDISLERGDEEDVDFNDVMPPNDEMGAKDLERNLCAYVIKLKSLFKLDMLTDTHIEERIKLNANVLGTLYQSIIDETIFREQDPSKAIKKLVSNPATSVNASSQPQEQTQIQEELEPIEEFSQEETDRRQDLQEDPIEEDGHSESP
ncbi:cohesin subunit IRR1 Ecym_4355 [Eremothecium cymbalariae DBVPG|uniref:SCD domain-containing protein n=1 Tax=Eremothecium cymbalariae (strain CBS 270.75 / DBVPG 7215 / KCTC 17166 / NRRL Y-17582) TaxID=931890 RepID=G8JTR2_ERECY|nr:hypothetical protein Ecym_4355 [Eremothecium cymbalariae DBVPG\